MTRPRISRLAWPVAAFAALCGGCRPRPLRPSAPPPPGTASPSGPTGPAVKIERGSSVFKDPQGRTLWTVDALQGTGQLAGMEAQLKDARCVLYAGGKPVWRCRADTLVAEKPTEEVRLSGRVAGSSVDGEREFRLPAATWRVRTGQITGGPHAWFRIGRVELNGDRLYANTNQDRGRVVGHVKGRILGTGRQR